jgi:hypothetical protein
MEMDVAMWMALKNHMNRYLAEKVHVDGMKVYIDGMKVYIDGMKVYIDGHRRSMWMALKFHTDGPSYMDGP